MRDMKALVLTAGKGTRFAKESKKSIHKCLAEINGKHIVDFSLDVAVKLDLEEIVMVVGYLAEAIMQTYGDSYQGIPIKYALQVEQHGLVHAMACGQEALKGSDFCLFLGDEVFIQADHLGMLHTFYTQDAFLICGIVPTDNLELVRKNYSVAFDELSQRVLCVTEKPSEPFNTFIGTGSCVFRHKIFDYVDAMSNDPKTGDKELAGLIQCATDDQRRVLCHNLRALHYMNINTYEDFLCLEHTLAEVKL
jgi:dTDP-glucose pyrophosphorylase